MKITKRQLKQIISESLRPEPRIDDLYRDGEADAQAGRGLRFQGPSDVISPDGRQLGPTRFSAYMDGYNDGLDALDALSAAPVEEAGMHELVIDYDSRDKAREDAFRSVRGSSIRDMVRAGDAYDDYIENQADDEAIGMIVAALEPDCKIHEVQPAMGGGNVTVRGPKESLVKTALRYHSGMTREEALEFIIPVL